MSGVSHKIDRFGVVFDDESLVADAGLVAAATLMGRLGLASLVDASVRLGRRPGAAAPGRKVATLVAAMLVGATHIDHVDRLRAGATGAVLGFRPAAPSTVGSFLRAFTWGHVRQLDKAAGAALRRPWAAGGGPGEAAMTIDVDSTVCAVSGATKAGAAYRHTQQLGYHPLVGVRAETGEILATRLRKGSSQSGHVHFVAETIGRARRAGAAGELCVRADSGFFSYDLLDRLDALGVRWSITIALYGHVKAAIARIPDADWAPIAYPAGGQAHIAETTLIAGSRGEQRSLRLVVRGTRLTDEAQAELWPHWRYHAFITNRTDLDTLAGRLPPPTRHRRIGHPRPQGEHRLGPPAVGELRRQRRLADLRRTGPQPLPVAHPPRQGPPPRQAHRRTDRPQPTPRPTRAPRQPQRPHHLAPTRTMALGNHLPHRTHQHPQPAPTRLNPPASPTAADPHRPHAPRTRRRRRTDTRHRRRHAHRQPNNIPEPPTNPSHRRSSPTKPRNGGSRLRLLLVPAN